MTNVMTMGQLDKVAGGTCQETDQIINALGKVTKETVNRLRTSKLWR